MARKGAQASSLRVLDFAPSPAIDNATVGVAEKLMLVGNMLRWGC